MSKDSREFEHESYQDSESIVRYLDAIQDGFKKGQLVLGNSDESVTLEPSGLLKLSLKAKRKGKGSKLTFKVSWKEGEEESEPPSEPTEDESTSE